MNSLLRRTLIAGAAISLLFSLLWLRLDAGALSASFKTELERTAGSSFTAASASLTLLPGIGLRFEQAKLKHPDFEMQAGHIDVGIHLIPLLLGKTEIESLDLHDADFRLVGGAKGVNLAVISSLPVEHIHLIRSNITAADGSPLLSNLHMELRGIGADRETLWELNAQQEKQSLSGHGRLEFRDGSIESGFGKLKLEQLPVASLRSVAPESLFDWVEGRNNHLTGSLTLDITKQQRWSIFGELLLKNEAELSEVKLRGKLSHPSAGELVWRDSFIHLDAKAVVAIEGACKKSRCNTRIDARQIPLARWSPFVPKGVRFHRNITGTTNLLALINWSENSWHGNASFTLKNAAFRHAGGNIALPELHLQSSELSGSSDKWLARAAITSPEAAGAMHIHSSRDQDGAKEMIIETGAADSRLWEPLANLLLASLGAEPELAANGPVSGKLQLSQHKQKKQLHINIDATGAEISYGEWMKKPPGIVAECRASVVMSGLNVTTTSLQNCIVDNSSVQALHWTKQKLSIDKLSMHFDQLNQQNIQLPESLRALRGMIEGSATASRTEPEQHWSDNMNATWRLQNFGADDWHLNGTLEANHGIFSTRRLLVDGKYGHAELRGTYEPARRRGSIDVISGALQWRARNRPDEFWSSINIRGKIRNTSLKLLDNSWQQLSASYQFSKGSLQLSNFKAGLAGGTCSGKKLSFSPGPDGLAIRGAIRGKNIRLQELHGAGEWLQADVSGNLHANIRLNGIIPNSDFTSWQRSNGDILIYNGAWKQQLQPASLTERLGIKKPSLKSYAFRKLEFRFRIHEHEAAISKFELLRQKRRYLGKATITPELILKGRIQDVETHSIYQLESKLPRISWSSQ